MELIKRRKKDLTYHVEGDGKAANDSRDIAITVSFTSKITEEQIPQALKGHTLFINPSGVVERNLIENLEILREAAIASYLQNLTSYHSTKT